MSGSLVITGVGAVTPVGLSAPASCAALRAGVARLKEIHAYRVEGELIETKPTIGGRVPTEWFRGGPVEDEWPGHERFAQELPPPLDALVEDGTERLLQLALPAVWQAAEQADLASCADTELGLYIALGGFAGEDDPEPLAEQIRQLLQVTPRQTKTFASGRAAGLAALAAAQQAIEAGEVRRALVVAADSLIRGRVLRQLDLDGKLKSPVRAHGVIPGEAAGAVCLEAQDSAEARGCRALARIGAVSTAQEETVAAAGLSPADDDEPTVNEARALTDVVRLAWSGAEDRDLNPLVVCDLNGARDRAMEWSFASLRVFGSIHGHLEIWHAADCCGDMGAATGLVNTVWAAMSVRTDFAREVARQVLVWGASDGPLRGAALIQPA